VHGTTRVEQGNFDAFLIMTDAEGNALTPGHTGGSGE